MVPIPITFVLQTKQTPLAKFLEEMSKRQGEIVWERCGFLKLKKSKSKSLQLGWGGGAKTLAQGAPSYNRNKATSPRHHLQRYLREVYLIRSYRASPTSQGLGQKSSVPSLWFQQNHTLFLFQIFQSKKILPFHHLDFCCSVAKSRPTLCGPMDFAVCQASLSFTVYQKICSNLGFSRSHKTTSLL